MSWDAEAILRGNRLCLCGRAEPKRVGEPLELGDVVGFAIEGDMRWARVTGFIKEHVPLESLGAARVIVREFRPGDGRWPTGDHVRAWLIVPWEHEHPTYELRPAQEPLDWHADGLFKGSARPTPSCDRPTTPPPGRSPRRRARR